MNEQIALSEDERDCYQEITNVAMGQAADRLARLLGVYVVLPIPNVNIIEINEFKMTLKSLEGNATVSAVCQGFIGAGIAGEALLIFNDASFTDIAKLLDYPGNLDKHEELEMLMDVANVLNGACIQGIGGQLDIDFSQSHPVVLGQHCSISDLLSEKKNAWQRTMAIEINYTIEDHNINCDLLLLFTEESVLHMNRLISFLLDD
ncbi:MAG: histidine kinase [Bermanella sp.]|mgnify:FL=1|nr:histidine kinase [Bermanella sp.]|tara:strand:- start:1126 stop:1740 length:615 start_codon:yes stop_codon:yes gene_type:complete